MLLQKQTKDSRKTYTHKIWCAESRLNTGLFTYVTIRREWRSRIGGFDPNYKISADYLNMLKLSLIRSLASTTASKFLPLGFSGRNCILGLRGSLGGRVGSQCNFFDYSYRRYLSPIIRDEHNLKNPSALKASYFEEFRGMPGAAMAMDFKSYLPEDIIVRVDRASMLASHEIRAPFLTTNLLNLLTLKC